MAKKKASGSLNKAKRLVRQTPHVAASKILADTHGKGSLTEKVHKARVRTGTNAENKDRIANIKKLPKRKKK